MQEFCDNCLMDNKNMINKLGISNPSSSEQRLVRYYFFHLKEEESRF